MSIEVSFNDQEKIIEARVIGDFDYSAIQELVPQIAGLVKEKDCRKVFLDARQMSVSLSTAMIYMAPEKMAKEFEKFDLDVRNISRALLITEFDKNLRFLETVSLNQSQSMRLFKDEAAAKKWLNE